jgi:hypothetical protein
MAHTDPSPTTQITHGETSGDQPSQVTVLDPPFFSFMPTPSNLRPSTGQTSVTQVEHGDDEQLLVPEPTSQNVASNTTNVTHQAHQASELISNLSQDQQQFVQHSPTEPTSQDVASNTTNVTHQAHQASELILNLSQDKQQSVQQPPTPSTEPQTMLQTVPQTPQIYITFLLVSGRKRTMSFEPESPIGSVKELAWNSWPTG